MSIIIGFIVHALIVVIGIVIAGFVISGAIKNAVTSLKDDGAQRPSDAYGANGSYREDGLN